MLIMLSADLIFKDTPFIKYKESGYIGHLPHVNYCLVEYDKNFYDDDLFARFGQPFPDVLKNASIKRKAEYLAGRYCGQSLLQKKTTSSIIGTYQRIPQWPNDWCGSISHTGKYAIVVVVPQSVGLMPGIDIENLCPNIMFESADMFTSFEEKNILLKSKLPYALALLIVFSAKESLYKSIWNKVKRILDFKAAKIVALDDAQQSFTLTLTDSLTSALRSGSEYIGRYAFFKDTIITCISTANEPLKPL